MLYTLNTDIYVNGFTINELNCIQNPIAGACSAYNYDYYYYTGFICSIINNWGRKENRYINFEQYLELHNKALDLLSIHLHSQRIETKEEFLTLIKESLLKRIPIILKVKYNAIFYSQYYKSQIEQDYHVLLVDSYNTDTGIITVKDTSFFRGSSILKTDADILYPVALTEDMVFDMLTKTCADGVYNPDELLIYTVEQDKNASTTTKIDLLEFAISSYKNEKNLFVSLLEKLEENQDRIVRDFEDINRFFSGSIEGMFKVLYLWLEEAKADDVLEEFRKFGSDYITCRKRIMYYIYKKSMSGRTGQKDTTEDEIHKIESYDAKLMSYLKTFKLTYLKEVEEDRIYVNLEQLYNNKALSSTAGADTLADISGTGVYFYIPEFRNLIKNEGYRHFLDEAEETKSDNISCNGQSITIEKGIYKKLSILACAEYGSYKESIGLYLDEQEKSTLPFHVSDFYANPGFGERTFCFGEAYQKNGETVEKLNFLSRIFRYDIILNEKEINRIQLPVRKNIHIFAITLGR